MRAATLLLAGFLPAAAAPVIERGPLVLEPIPAARFSFGGPVGERIHANVDEWLLRAPQANPGLLEMFRRRDRQPPPRLVPWAGEFAGKYLISAVQALRLSDDPRLRAQVDGFVAELIATQADDGYLGPFPRSERLLKHWDLWGHYHVILGLLLWHEQAGDPAALETARRAADLVCRTYLDTGRRVFDAGDPEMNMAVIHGLGKLHRLTGEARYLRMMREIEKDWERAGDYLRAGLDGREFFQSPRPRWESLHDLQGLLELWRITGEARYRDAFAHHWRSIRRWDRRNTGGFSSGEQATGNPYAATAIETCCTVAWMALTLDYLQLTGDPAAADELELSTLNGGLGAQHPSGRWWTYDTPMDGAREASAQTIVFQARAGTPELNCCSVNGPRVPGLLADWAVMGHADGLVVNWLGPAETKALLADGTPVLLQSESRYPVEGRVTLAVEPAAPREFTLRVRVPAWAGLARFTIETPTGSERGGAKAGEYLAMGRTWRGGERVTLEMDLPLRAVPGAREAAGRVSLYRGPLLLAFDPRQNPFDEDTLPALDLERLDQAAIVSPPDAATARDRFLRPWLACDVPASPTGMVRLVDFASAGATGTRYRTWLPAEPVPPAPAFTTLPADGARVPPGPVPFRWRSPREPAGETTFSLRFSTNASGSEVAARISGLQSNRLVVDLARLGLTNAGPVFWQVAVSRAGAETVAEVPPAFFLVDRAAPPVPLPPDPVIGPDGELVQHFLRAGDRPRFGELRSPPQGAQHPDGTDVEGRATMIVLAVPEWPEEDFTVLVRARIRALPPGRIGQVFSGWASGMDDPLRLVVDNGRLFARIEAGRLFATPGTPVEVGRWYAVAAVKQGATLRLYVDGREAGAGPAPEVLSTNARACALGGNPLFGGDESLAARFADFALYARALTAAEIAAWAGAPLSSPGR